MQVPVTEALAEHLLAGISQKPQEELASLLLKPKSLERNTISFLSADSNKLSDRAALNF
jgi:hypothetical protein